ncbi:alpha/beta-gliadin clone PW1215 isoform X1 [Ischnura elegans]|uniref:alpha/beta-gliadin clone PW1215 isoform X1 n=1 Tax=Ischnura elegans TaxID=197161 RepID=UPI001ED8AE7D|nr:alpha/beta-gliadin clone PW1215 isoform X1 [Ischnura elegans]
MSPCQRMNMGPLWALLVVFAAAAQGEGRFRRQAHHLGAPQQFGLSPRPVPSQGPLRPAGPQLSFQFVPQQAYRQEGPTSAPQLLTVRPVSPQPSIQQQQTPRPRPTAAHIPSTAFLPTPRPAPASPQPVSSTRRPQHQQQGGGGSRGRQSVTREQLVDELPEDEEELDKPDRLTELLPLSKFDCSGRGTGYYADEGLQCEVFHYCQGGARHSWICPEGFSFHQVHLICMPPSHDNICKKSSQYHFVNDYLYRPLNAEEAQTKPNVTLRYADRYYPENYDRDEDDVQQPLVFNSPQSQRLPAPQAKRPQQQVLRPQQVVRLVQQPYRSNNQVFHSPEEVNIPLQQRRPLVQQRSQDSYEDDDYEERPSYRQG